MKQFIGKVLLAIVKFEHTIYCMTNCKVELPLHKSYYKWREHKYETYVNHKYDW